MNHPNPDISIIMATHNRKDVVLHTLTQLDQNSLDRANAEIIVVDNQSTDGTVEALRDRVDVLISLRYNAGSCAKASGVDRARGKYILFLDDDSYPRTGSISRMIEYFEQNPKLGAAGFQVHLPDGRNEGGALPDVFLGCGVGFRSEALHAAGGLDRSFFMQAEEYDLTFRMTHAGWQVRMFDDLHVDHLKTIQARKTDRTTYYDIRNNLRVLARYLPNPCYKIYLQDCLQRYSWLAEIDQHHHAYRRGVRAGKWRAMIERIRYRSKRLSPQSFEHFYRWNFIQLRMKELSKQGIRNIIFADLGKNIYPFYQGALDAGLQVLSIGDDRFASIARKYRGIPIIPLQQVLDHSADAIIVSNTASVFADVTHKRLRTMTTQPTCNWFGRLQMDVTSGFHSPSIEKNTDTIDEKPLIAIQG